MPEPFTGKAEIEVLADDGAIKYRTEAAAIDERWNVVEGPIEVIAMQKRYASGKALTRVAKYGHKGPLSETDLAVTY